MANKALWKTKIPPPEPAVADVLDLWRFKYDTLEIARLLRVHESVIYNILARLSK